MKAKRFWYGLDRSIPVIGFGCWQIAGNHEIDGRPNGWGEIDERQARELISKALDAGIRFFDTAQGYGHGSSERILGAAIKHHPLGQEAVVCTKIKAPSLTSSISIEKEIDQAIDLSLKRLDIDCVDIVMLHNPEDDYPYKQGVIDAFEKQRHRGRIKTYGVSARTLYGIKNAISSGFGTCVEWSFNLLERRPIEDIFPMCRAHKINFIARSPLARGLLSEKFFNTKERSFPQNEFRSTLDQNWINWVGSELQRINNAGLPMDQISQLAIQYILKFDQVSAVIPGVHRLSHLSSLRSHIDDDGMDNKTFEVLNNLLPDCYPGFE